MIVNQKNLLAALAKCASVVDRKSPLLALTNVLIVGGELTASDLRRTVFASVPIAGDPVECLVSAHDLLDRVGKLEGDVTMTADESSLTVRSGSRRYKLPTMSADDYPTMVEQPSFNGCECRGPEQLCRAIDRTIYAASQDATRGALNAALLCECASNLRIVATDGHRLATSIVAAAWEYGDVLIPRDSLAAIRKLIDRAETVLIVVEGETVFVRAIRDEDTATIAVKRTGDQYPPWHVVVPESQPMSCTVDASDLASALAAVGLSSDERMGRVVMRPGDDGGLHVEASGAGGEASDTIPCEGTIAKWACSAGYLYDAVRHLDGDVTLGTEDSISPMCVRHDGAVVGVIMPVRI